MTAYDQYKKYASRPLLSGINLQFVIYFLLFSYVPLLIFSVFGYFLNKRIIRDAHQLHLKQITGLSAQNLRTYQNYLQSELRNVMLFHLHTGSAIEKILVVFPDMASKFNQVTIIQDDSITASFGEKTGVDFSAPSKNLSLVDSKYLLIAYKYDDENQAYGLVDANKIREILPGLIRMDRVYLQNDFGILRIFDGTFSADDEHLESLYPMHDGWILKIQRSTEKLYRELQRFLIEIILANLFIGILIFILALVLSKRITNPIRILLDAVQKISKGDLSQPVQVDTKNEIKILADEFEVMRQKLNKSYSGLESIIDERTAALREAQFQISHQEKMASLGLLAAGVAHEIGNPLTSISSMAQLIKRKVKDQQFIEYLNTILKNIERISTIVRELVDFARPASYKAEYVDINEIIRNAVSIVKYDKRAKRIDIKFELDPDIPPLFLVSDQLLQVCLNILINAVDVLKNEKDRIIVKSMRAEETFIIQIEDTGMGIPAENISKIFEPFFTTKKVGKGTGLGLSVSYGIIKNLNGFIDVQSETGKGSVFTISLPAILAEKKNEG